MYQIMLLFPYALTLVWKEKKKKKEKKNAIAETQEGSNRDLHVNPKQIAFMFYMLPYLT
jgi:hypothetical protein